MYLDSFFAEEGGLVKISPEQGSRFAKEISDDFNPLHNPDSKRFCVPGDLLFAISLARYGLSEKMTFNYSGMVGKGINLVFPNEASDHFAILDDKGKEYLDVACSGDTTNDAQLIESFSKAYVAFSGHSFPHILVPLMKANDVMINPDRPMVIYESMAFEFDSFDAKSPNLELVDSQLTVQGKRGQVKMVFEVSESGKVIGKGCKTMVLSGLRAYDQEKVDELIHLYELSKSNYEK